MDGIQYLRKIRRVLEHGWCQGAAAKDRQGTAIKATEPEAQRFCLVGASIRAGAEAPVYKYRHERAAWRAIAKAVIQRLGLPGDKDPFKVDLAWHDDNTFKTQTEVIRVVDEAIALLEAEEQAPT